jgi:hypothetical protein
VSAPPAQGEHLRPTPKKQDGHIVNGHLLKFAVGNIVDLTDFMFHHNTLSGCTIDVLIRVSVQPLLRFLYIAKGLDRRTAVPSEESE